MARIVSLELSLASVVLAGGCEGCAAEVALGFDGGARLAAVPGALFDDAGVPVDEDGGGKGSSGDGEGWVKIDSSSAYTPRSSAWRFSAAPGFGPAEWAMGGDDWPEAWDRENHMQVVNDPIGRALEINRGDCLVPGRGVQAVRVEPTSAAVALVRMRVTFPGASDSVARPRCPARDRTPPGGRGDSARCAAQGASCP